MSGKDRRREPSRAALVALSLLPVLLGAGCSDDDPEPKFGPPSSEAPTSPSTSTTAAPAALTPEETVRAWVDAQNQALHSGDTSALAALSHDLCKTCGQFIDPIEAVYASGGFFRGGTWEVAAARKRPNSKTPTVVDAGVEIAGGTTKESSDAEPVEYGADKRVMEFRLMPADDGWTISFIGFVS